MPFSPILRNLLKVEVSREGKSCGLFAPSGHSREAIRTVADYSKIVRNRLRLHSKLSNHARLIAREVASPVQLNHSGAHYTLTQILVGCADDDLFHPVVL